MDPTSASVLTLQCPDQPGIVAAVANLIAGAGR
jgi:formyltetrahydrofolate hydrolase